MDLSEHKQKVVAVVGSTASGKTGIAIRLAKRFAGEVISADSRQVYRGLDIGTEKVTQREMRDIPHHLIDVADPKTSFSAQDFRNLGRKTINEIAARGNLPIVAGGTGFYVSSLLDDVMLPEVSPNEALRAELEPLGAPELLKRLRRLDPHRAETIDPHNKRRLIRAIEIAEALGEVPQPHNTTSPYDVLYIGLSVPDDELRARINTRLDQTLERGLLDETKRLIDSDLSSERIDELGLEYRICAAHLRGLPAQAGELSYDEMVRELKTKVWQYAKRQKTWFKRDERIEWFGPDELKDVEERVEAFLKIGS